MISIFHEEAKHAALDTYDWKTLVESWQALLPVNVNVHHRNGISRRRVCLIEIDGIENPFDTEADGDAYRITFNLENVVYGPADKNGKCGELNPNQIFSATVFDLKPYMRPRVQRAHGEGIEYFEVRELLMRLHPWTDPPSVLAKRPRSPVEDDDEEEERTRPVPNRHVQAVSERVADLSSDVGEIDQRVTDVEARLSSMHAKFEHMRRQLLGACKSPEPHFEVDVSSEPDETDE